MSKLKYTEFEVTFQEVPGEITLCINVSNCPYHCKGCHSPYLQTDCGRPLDLAFLRGLLTHCIEVNQYPITCVVFMGDGGNLEELGKLIEFCHEYKLKTCLYTGNSDPNEAISKSNNSLDYIKVGPYIPEKGPLNSPTTNQRFYSIKYENDNYTLTDLTHKFYENSCKTV